MVHRSKEGEGAMSGRLRWRSAPIRLRVSHVPRMGRFLLSVLKDTAFVQVILLFAVLWMLFAAGIWLAERGAVGSTIESFSDSLYWGVAAFSTAGIADTPRTGVARLLGGIWIVVGSTIFFGSIVATVTAFFMRPLQRPAKQIVDTIEYNLEHLEDLSLAELELLRRTTDALIQHMERVKVGDSEAASPQH